MPELPEVQTTVAGLAKVLPRLRITDVWTDLAVRTHTTPHLSQSLKDKNFFKKFKQIVVDSKVVSVERRAKNILINLANKETILIHMKMTGHLMVGKYIKVENKKTKTFWQPATSEKNDALRDPYNKYLHVVFSLSNGKQLVLSDARKFAKVTLVPTEKIATSIHLGHLGPEPLEKKFTFKEFKLRLNKRPRGKIKEVLMDQSVIAGVGNIYSDEMLWLSGIHPGSITKEIPPKYLQILYTAMQKVLHQGIDFGGDSTSDYRDINGKRGKFQHHHNVYRMTGKPCSKKACTGKIIRTIIGGRSAHFCNSHQKMLK